MNVWLIIYLSLNRSMAECLSKVSHRSEYIRVFDNPSKMVFVDLPIPSNLKFDDCDYYTVHVNQTHGIDFNPPNVYCKPCDRHYTSNNTLRIHIRTIHKMYLPRLLANNKSNPDILPDPNDPNFYCRSCVHYYKTKGIFHRHCRDIHNMNIPITRLPRPNERIEPDPTNDPSFYCKLCDYPFSFVRHLKRIHNK